MGHIPMKQIPNIVTLLNLFSGCFAIVCIMQTGLTISVDANAENLVDIPEKIYLASFFICIHTNGQTRLHNTNYGKATREKV